MFIGLCAACKYMQVINSAKGSTFFRCMYSKIDETFLKYPQLPVFACSGYQPKDKKDPPSIQDKTTTI